MNQQIRGSAWRLPTAVAVTAALAVGGLVPATLASASTPSSDTPVYVDVTATGVSPGYDTVVPVTLSSRSISYFSNTGMQIGVNSATGAVVLEQIETRTAELQVSVVLTDYLDTVESAFTFDDNSKLYIFVRGTRADVPVLVKVTSPNRHDLSSESTVETVIDAPALELDGLAGFGAAGSSPLALYYDDATGTFRGQRINAASHEPTGAAIALAFSDVDRIFDVSPSTNTVVSAREGGIDVTYLFSPAVVRTAEIPELGEDIELTVHGTHVVATDSDGTVALVTASTASTPVLSKLVQLDARPKAVAMSFSATSQLGEFQVVPASGDEILRFAGSDGAQRETIALDGLSVVDGSLTMTHLQRPAWTFLASVDGETYRYSGMYHSAPKITFTAITPHASNPDGNTRFQFVSRGDATITNVWQYSLDGGRSWATRGAEWQTAVADTGTTLTERPALADPLNGKAASYRQNITEDVQLPVMLTRDEPSIKLPRIGYSALWRVAATNPRGTTVSAAQSIATPGGVDESALRVTSHPVSSTVSAATQTTFTATANLADATIQWQRSLDNGGTWENIARRSTTSVYTLSASLTSHGHLFRAAFTSGETTVYSEAARLSVTVPAAKKVGAATEGAVAITGGDLVFDVSDYARSHQWGRVAHGDGVALGESGGFTFDQADGWFDRASGAAQLSWSGAAVYLPYAGLNGLHVTLANPLLAVAEDGRATLTVDAAWNNGGGQEAGEFVDSKGFARVIYATFADTAVSVGDDGAVTITGTPEWENRTYLKPGLADDTKLYPASYPASLLDYLHDSLRGWFLQSGGEFDHEKAPDAISVSFVAGTEQASTEGDVLDPIDPLGDGRYPFADVAPGITVQPAAETVVEFGTSVTLVAAASGYPAPTVRWQRQAEDGSWVNVAGATRASLVLNGREAGETTYRAVFTNGRGSATTDAALVRVVGVAPVVTTQPESITIADGGSTTLVAGASGVPTPTVQWESRSSGGSWTPIAGATETTLTIEKATTASSGTEYRAVFTNPAGTVASSAATVTVKKAALSAKVAATAFGTRAKVVITATNREGEVTVKTGAFSKTVTLTNGKATVSLPRGLAVGTHRVTVTHAGDALFTKASVSTTVKVAKAKTSTSVKVTKTPTSRAAGKVAVTVKSATGVAVSGKVTLTAKKGSVTKKFTTTVKNGKATITLPKSAKGTWTIKATYSASKNFSASSKSVKVKVTR